MQSTGGCYSGDKQPDGSPLGGITNADCCRMHELGPGRAIADRFTAAGPAPVMSCPGCLACLAPRCPVVGVVRWWAVGGGCGVVTPGSRVGWG